MSLPYIVAAAGLVIYLVQLAAVRRRLARTAPPEGFAPAVSILKPLKGLDDNLSENLESFCLLDYPEYEIIFALRRPDDPAIEVARKIMEMYPDREISIVAEWCEEGLNPKVNSLIPAYRSAKHGIFLISDSNVQVDSGYLRETVAHMADPNVGLVSNLIKGVGARSIGALFENLHLNTFIIGGVCFMEEVLGQPCVIGKSMLIRKDWFERSGGFAAVKDYLAEDYIIGRRIKESGGRVVLSSHLINTVNQRWDIGQFIARHTRWGRLRWNIGGPAYVTELFANPVLMSVVPLLFYGPGPLTLGCVAAAWVAKTAGDYYTGRLIGAGISAPFYALTPVKDLIIAAAWVVPIFSSRVEWRGDTFIIGRQSRLYPCSGAKCVTVSGRGR